jgi:hypothetical protein
MKNLFLSLSTLATLTFFACGNQNKSANNQEDSTATETMNTENLNCYIAVNEADTAYLNMNQKGKKVTGELKFDFATKQKTDGQISGEFIGDTLFVDYNYKIDGVAYKNPQVFLKKDDQLLQGAGELEVYVGRTYFKKSVPINFDRGFIFKLSSCK